MSISNFLRYFDRRPPRSGIYKTRICTDYVDVLFTTGVIYRYTRASVGTGNLDRMKTLATQGDALNSFILRTPGVKHRWSERFTTHTVNNDCPAPPETCCMYPRSGYPDSFSFEDLPEKLNVDFPEGSGEWTLDVTAGIYTPSGTYTLGDLGYGYAESGDWVLWYPDPLEETYPNRAISPCLITGDGNYTPGDDAVEDQFEATYQVDYSAILYPFPDDVPTGIFTVTRSSLCYWESDFDRDAPTAAPEGAVAAKVTLYFSDTDQKFYTGIDAVQRFNIAGEGDPENLQWVTVSIVGSFYDGGMIKDPYQSAPDADGGVYKSIYDPTIGSSVIVTP
jgi:hypothetical protein